MPTETELRNAANTAVAFRDEIEKLQDQYESETYKLERVATQFLRFVPGKSSQHTTFNRIEDDTVVFDTSHSDWETLQEVNHGEISFTFAELADAEGTGLEIKARATKAADEAREREIKMLENRLERMKGK